MKKLLRRILISGLCLAMVAPMAVVAKGAPAAAKKEEDYSPIIVIPGIGQSPVDYYDDDGTLAVDDDGKEIGGYYTMIVADTRNIVPNLLKTLLVPALATLLFQFDLGFSKAGGKLIEQILGAQEMNPDGTLAKDVRARRMCKSVADMEEYDRNMFYRQVPMNKLGEEIGEDKLYFFAYSLLGDAIQTAKELDEFIQEVKDQTGSDKVTLCNLSLGGTVYVAYLDQFAHKNDLDHVINMVAVLDGSDAVADLFDRSFALYDRYVYSELIPDLLDTLGMGMDEAYIGSLISVALRLLPRKAYENLLVEVFDYLHGNMLINNAQMWATVPSDRYQSLRAKYLSDAEHATLRKNVDDFFAMKARHDQNTLDAVATGVKINNICGYGLKFGDIEYPIFGAGKSTLTSNTDGIIQIASTSQGASWVSAGTEFAADYVQKKPSAEYPAHSYIAPNRSVDASTCVLPDNTWFFEDQHHEAGRNDIMINLASALILDPELENVHSKPDVWPQFNGTARTDWMRRDWIPKAQAALENDELEMTAAVRAELEAAMKAAQELIGGSIADDAKTKEVGKRLTDALHAAGITDFNDRQPVDPSFGDKLLNGIFKALDDICFYLVGARGFSDWWRMPKYPGFFNGFGVLRAH